MNRDIIIGKNYRHFKGNIYKVIALGKHSETLELLVIYKNQKDEIWVRPYNMFNSLVDKEKYPNVEQLYRFEELK